MEVKKYDETNKGVLFNITEEWKLTQQGKLNMQGDEIRIIGVKRPNKDGQPIISDINGYNLVSQVFGFGPADLSSIYEVRSAVLNFENKVDGRISEIKRKYIVAKDRRDIVGMMEAEREMGAMQRRHPDKIDNDTLERSYKATQSDRERVINGITRDDKLNNPYAEQLLLLN